MPIIKSPGYIRKVTAYLMMIRKPSRFCARLLQADFQKPKMTSDAA